MVLRASTMLIEGGRVQHFFELVLLHTLHKRMLLRQDFDTMDVREMYHIRDFSPSIYFCLEQVRVTRGARQRLGWSFPTMDQKMALEAIVGNGLFPFSRNYATRAAHSFAAVFFFVSVTLWGSAWKLLSPRLPPRHHIIPPLTNALPVVL